jgi:hypothetical protein
MHNTQMTEVEQLAYMRVHELATYVTMDAPSESVFWFLCITLRIFYVTDECEFFFIFFPIN